MAEETHPGSQTCYLSQEGQAEVIQMFEVEKEIRLKKEFPPRENMSVE